MTAVFDLDAPDGNAPEPFALKYLDGTTSEPFHVVSEATGAFAYLAGQSLRGGVIIAESVMVQLILAVLVPEDEERFRAAIADKERHVSSQVIARITAWLLTEYGRRPFDVSSAFSAPPPSSEPTSANGSATLEPAGAT